MSQALINSLVRVSISGTQTVAKRSLSSAHKSIFLCPLLTNNSTNLAQPTNTSNWQLQSQHIATRYFSSARNLCIPPSLRLTTKISSRELSTAASRKKPSTDTHGTVIATGPDGSKYAIPLKPLGGYNQKRHAPKLAPSITKRRIQKLRTVSGKARNIRHSPWRLNLICQFAAGQTVNEALLQLKFVEKAKAPLVAALIQGTANNAKMTHGLQKSQLEVAECFATHGTHLKRVKFMGRGRTGRKLRRFSHMRVVLREIDFPLKIVKSTTVREREGWVERMNVALKEQEQSRKEQEEIEKLEREVREMEKKNESEKE